MERLHGLTVRILAVLAVLGLAAAAFFFGPKEVGRRPWRAFDLIVLGDGGTLSAAHDRLVAAGERPIDRIDATVEIENFLGGEWIAVDSIDERFDAADPRLDPFVRAAGTLFSTVRTGTELVYLPRRGSILSRRRELRALLDGIPFRFVGWNPTPAILSAVGAALAMLLALRTRFVRRWPIALGILAVTAHALAGGPAGLVRGVLVGYAWAVYLDRQAFREREYLAYGSKPPFEAGDRFVLLYLAVSAGIAMVTLAGEPTDSRPAALLSWVAMTAALGGVTIVWHLVHRDQIRSSEHRLFAPRPILERAFGNREHGSPLIGGVPWAVGALLVALAVVFLVSDKAGESETLMLPIPEHFAVEPGPETAMDDYRALVEAARSILPRTEPLSTAGFFAHRWYQEGLVYGAEFRLPDYGEAVTLEHFIETEDGIRSTPERVITFDEAWIEEQIEWGAHGVYRIVIEEGGVFVVRPGPVRVTMLDPRRTVQLLAAILFSVAPLAIGLRTRGVLGTVKAVSMREQQNA